MNEIIERRNEIVDTIRELAQEYIQTWDGWEEGLVTAFHLPCEVLLPNGARANFDVDDRGSSRYTAMGLLFASLHDPRWLDPARVGE